MALADADITPEYLANGTRYDTGEITVDHPLSGAFTVRSSELNRLDVRFHVYQPAEPQGTLILRLWRSIELDKLIVEERIDPANLTDGQVATFYFAPEAQAPGTPRAYSARISTCAIWPSVPRF